jgi:hypothetical protein
MRHLTDAQRLQSTSQIARQILVRSFIAVKAKVRTA